MKKFLVYLKNWIRPSKRSIHTENEFAITEGLPIPIRNVEYREVLRIFKTLNSLPSGSSFPIRSDLAYAVRKIVRDHFPEYRVIIKSFGSSYRVFRRA